MHMGTSIAVAIGLAAALIGGSALRATSAEQSKKTGDNIQPSVAGEYSANCRKKPDRGPCKAIFEAYYFDSGSRSCKKFVWGGCQGVVPFKTLEDCQNTCITPRPK